MAVLPVAPALHGFSSQTLIVPPPLSRKGAGLATELTVTPPVKLIVAPVLLSRKMPVPLSEIAPLKVIVPPVCPCTSTERPWRGPS